MDHQYLGLPIELKATSQNQAVFKVNKVALSAWNLISACVCVLIAVILGYLGLDGFASMFLLFGAVGIFLALREVWTRLLVTVDSLEKTISIHRRIPFRTRVAVFKWAAIREINLETLNDAFGTIKLISKDSNIEIVLGSGPMPEPETLSKRISELTGIAAVRCETTPRN